MTHFGVVLVRSGLFQRRVDGVESVNDASTGYLQMPGSTQQVAHPCGGDICTFLSLSEPLLGSLLDAAQRRPLAVRPLFTSPAADVAHRLLLARAAQAADAFELTERATMLGGRLLDAVVAAGTGAEPPLPARAWRLVDDARQALAHEDDLSLAGLAQRAGVSAFHLSRIFRRATGWTLSRYRTQLRVRRALERLADGERNLAALAADLGFADQAHLTRCVRAETGVTPGALRRLLHTR